MADFTIATQCCIAGGGPAGMMLGYLAGPRRRRRRGAGEARRFLPRFPRRHDPSLDARTDARSRTDRRVSEIAASEGRDGDRSDRRRAHDDRGFLAICRRHCKFIALMPQWDFLNFLAARGQRYPTFHLRMKAEATDLDRGERTRRRRRAQDAGRRARIRADLVVGAMAAIRRCARRAGFACDDSGAPMDVLWFRISRKASDPADTFGHLDAGRIMIMIDRSDYWQCGYVIRQRRDRSHASRRGSRLSATRVVECRRFSATASAN